MSGTSRRRSHLRAWSDPRLLLLNLGSLLASPLLLLNWIRRSVFRSKHSPFVANRLSGRPFTELGAGEGAHIVIAGASYGEAILIDRLTRALKESLGSTRITWAIRDPQTVAQLRETHPQQAVTAWPYENIVSASQWVKHTQPDVLVFVERFRFPNFVHAAKLSGAKVVLVNGRYGKTPSGYLRWVLSGFSTMLFQTEEYLAKASPALTAATRAIAAGDIKFDLTSINTSAETGAGIDLWIGGVEEPILAAGSTDSLTEEKVVLDSLVTIRNQRPVKLLIAPRKLERAEELVAEIKARGLSVSRRTNPNPDADVFVLDTMGELSYAYKHCAAAYVGGSLFGMGHNVIEPVEWGLPVAYGRNRGHFELMQKACEEAGVGRRVGDADELVDFWRWALEEGTNLQEACSKLVASNRGALEQTTQEISALIRELEAR